MRFIFITGGVVSSLGKGIASACVGTLLNAHGYNVVNIKIDPYLNCDPGTMNPLEHGEVFVTEDGAETDLDLGHYERFTNVNANKNCSFSSGQIYRSVIDKERNGVYLGKTIQVVPHITNEIKEKIKSAAYPDTDFVIVEVGGTVGDIESMPFLESIRQMAYDVGKDNVLYIHMALAPYLRASGEVKTKPVQQSVKEIGNLGIKPDVILCRAEKALDESALDKIALFCNVDKQCVFQALDVDNIYKLPLFFHQQYLDLAILNKFRMRPNRHHNNLLENWKKLEEKINHSESGKAKEKIRVMVVGKYIGLTDAYKSIYESLKHAAYNGGVELNIYPFDAEVIETFSDVQIDQLMKSRSVDGILVPGGFGSRGIEGKIRAAKYARENNIPYFGICLGMQIAVIEFLRNVAGITDATSEEFDADALNPVIGLMEDQKLKAELGGTMRLGGYLCEIANKDTNAYSAYKSGFITERHRHRYEFNSKYTEQLENNGMIISGINPEASLVEIVEVKDHPWYVGCQFHPEFKSRPLQPHPLFMSFIQAIERQITNGGR